MYVFHIRFLLCSKLPYKDMLTSSSFGEEQFSFPHLTDSTSYIGHMQILYIDLLELHPSAPTTHTINLHFEPTLNTE